MTSSPLFSILMTAYNREKLIVEAIESVLNSNYTNWELIIVDDRSTDNTFAIAQKYAMQDERIKVYINEQNLGDYPNRNKASTYAKGEFMLYVDSDDEIYPETISNLIEVLKIYPDLNFGMFYAHSPSPIKVESAEAIHNHFFKQQFLYIGPGGTILRRSFFNEINRYPEKYGPANDMYFNLKACCYSPIVLFPFQLVNYRVHDGQEINNSYSYLYNNYRYEKDSFNELPLPLSKKERLWLIKKMKRRFLVNVTKYFIKTKDLKKTYNAIKLTNYKFSDALIGIFQ
ncbi:glycosyltransferase family 2 protein [Ferruginibacter lapsinanis]|uniref:glycosyltransferase family 2 protein n=1 Tax=Ferruginibacter lapsinanis TaxID=563172 RepID=UPI001E2B44C5|nr:glycosyltransferase family A protein [Ferruginibacter lapsinanis]UEG49454.1 glycosyltransferase family 2 protein [Ferruginibacter lapsinanis]